VATDKIFQNTPVDSPEDEIPHLFDKRVRTHRNGKQLPGLIAKPDIRRWRKQARELNERGRTA
jgi:hypothetical protein